MSKAPFGGMFPSFPDLSKIPEAIAEVKAASAQGLHNQAETNRLLSLLIAEVKGLRDDLRNSQLETNHGRHHTSARHGATNGASPRVTNGP